MHDRHAPKQQIFASTVEFLPCLNNPYIGWTQMLVPKYKVSANNLTDKDIKNTTSPQHILPLQQKN